MEPFGDPLQAVTPVNTAPAWLVVTDLDGTLLDHHSYSYAPALEALHLLGAKHIPVILCSSKTRAEMERIRAQLHLDAPFIVENGAAICASDGAIAASRGEDVVLGTPYGELIAVLKALKAEHHFNFQGFHDMSVAEVASVTGLPAAEAALAGAREFSEPLVWRDSAQQRQKFLGLLAERGLTAQQGGRFLTVAGATDKARALAALRDMYGGPDRTRIIALGDSPNDETMLNAADVAVVVKSDKSSQLRITRPQRIIRTTERGPVGWNRAILTLMEEVLHG